MQANTERRGAERPILFKGAMVRALLAGTKTQTRRPLYVMTKNVEKACFDERYPPTCGNGEWPNVPVGSAWTLSQRRNAKPGDRLWVRESWMPDPPADGTWNYTAWAGCREGQIAAVPEKFRHPRYCNYAATWPYDSLMRWTPSIHMPRWASRITREVVSVHVERLQDISDADALAEGIYPTSTGLYPGSPKAAFQKLWESINGPGSWEANPWVLRIEFKPTEVPA